MYLSGPFCHVAFVQRGRQLLLMGVCLVHLYVPAHQEHLSLEVAAYVPKEVMREVRNPIGLFQGIDDLSEHGTIVGRQGRAKGVDHLRTIRVEGLVLAQTHSSIQEGCGVG